MHFESPDWPKLLVPDSAEEVALIYEALEVMHGLETLNWHPVTVGEAVPSRQASQLAQQGIWKFGRRIAFAEGGALPILDLQTTEPDLNVAVDYALRAIEGLIQDPA